MLPDRKLDKGMAEHCKKPCYHINAKSGNYIKDNKYNEDNDHVIRAINIENKVVFMYPIFSEELNFV